LDRKAIRRSHILRKLERFQAAIEAEGLVDPARQAADMREWARRRHG
jgi:hypothetical protein